MGEQMKKISPGDWYVDNDKGGSYDWIAIGEDCGYYNVVLVVDEPHSQTLGARAARLVAVWNFCSGFPTGALEKVTLAEVVEALNGLWGEYSDLMSDCWGQPNDDTPAQIKARALLSTLQEKNDG